MNHAHDPVEPALQDPALYFNRELSQLDFNFRVLAQARDANVPLLERLRYLCISCTNLDEFFEIRAATVRPRRTSAWPRADGQPPATILRRIHERAAELVEAQYRCWNEELRPELAGHGIRLLQPDEWNAQQREWLRAYFRDEIMPVLSPLGLDPAHPFPRILNKSLNIVVTVEGRDAFGREGGLAIVRAPRSLPRIIRLPDRDGDGDAFHDFVFLSTVLSRFVGELFPGMRVTGAYQFRVTRNSGDRGRGGSREPRPRPARRAWSAAATCARCGWRSTAAARSRSWTRCCATSSCRRTRCTASTAR